MADDESDAMTIWDWAQQRDLERIARRTPDASERAIALIVLELKRLSERQDNLRAELMKQRAGKTGDRFFIEDEAAEMVLPNLEGGEKVQVIRLDPKLAQGAPEGQDRGQTVIEGVRRE